MNWRSAIPGKILDGRDSPKLNLIVVAKKGILVEELTMNTALIRT